MNGEDKSRVYQEDTIEEIAEKIFYHFELLASCKILGWVYNGARTFKKGELVIKELARLDEVENCHTDTGGHSRRKRVTPVNTVGGFVAHKIFKYNKAMVDNEPKITIWRIQ